MEGKFVAVFLGVMLLISVISSASIPVYLRPIENGNKVFGKVYNYQWDYTQFSNCSGIIFSYSTTIQTDSKTGDAFVEIPVPDYSNLSLARFFCEYRDSVLRFSDELSDVFFTSIYAQNITLKNNITADYFKGKFNWTDDSPFLAFDSITLSFNFSLLNNTIDIRDTNETSRFNNLTAIDCGSTEKQIGVQNNGTILCAEDLTTNISYYLATNPDNFVSNTTMNKSVSCINIIGGSDPDFCVDAIGSGGNTTEEIQDAVGGAFDGNFTYNDSSDIITVNTNNLSTTLRSVYDTIYRLISSLIGNDDIEPDSINTTQIIDLTIRDVDINKTNVTLNDF